MTLTEGEQVLGLRWVTQQGEPKIAVTRWVNGMRQMTYEHLPFRHYGFVRTDKVSHVDTSTVFDVQFNETKFTTITGEPVTQVSVPIPGDLKELWLNNRQVEFYEADVPYGKKVFVDYDLNLPAEYKPVFCDIETDPRKATNDSMKQALQRVVSAGLGDSKFFCDDDEALLFSQLSNELQNYTCMVSWSDFDFTYLQTRAKLNHYRAPYVTSCEGIDMMYYFAQLVLKKTNNNYLKLIAAIDYMRKHGADVDELPDMGVKEDYSLVWQYFENDRKALEKYNVADAVSMRQIDEALHLTASMYELMRKFKIWPTEYRQHSKIEDMVKLRMARARGQVLSNRPSKHFDENEKRKGKKKGAYVFAPVAGYHEHIVVLDFASMYPSIMRSLNIGLDSVANCDKGEACNEHFKAANGIHYRKDMLSLNSEYLDYAQQFFNVYDAELKAAKPDTLDYTKATIKRMKTKLTKNANFGITGYATGRMYNEAVFVSTTSTGQALILKSSDFMQSNYSIPTIYGDTDSIFLKIPGALDYYKLSKTFTKLNEALKAFSLQKFGAEIDTEIELDYYADRAYFTSAKKRYLMHVAAQDTPPKPCDYVKVTGFETVRRDSTQLLRDTQALVFDPLLKGVTPLELEKQCKAHFEQVKRDLFAGKLDDKIIFTKGIRAELDTYKSSLPHTRAAKILQDLGQYNTGSDIEYIVISSDKRKTIKACGKCTNCTTAKQVGGWLVDDESSYPRYCIKPKKANKEFIDTYPNVADHPKIKPSGYAYVWQSQVVSILERVGMFVNDKEILLEPSQPALSQFWHKLTYSPLFARGYS